MKTLSVHRAVTAEQRSTLYRMQNEASRRLPGFSGERNLQTTLLHVGNVTDEQAAKIMRRLPRTILKPIELTVGELHIVHATKAGKDYRSRYVVDLIDESNTWTVEHETIRDRAANTLRRVIFTRQPQMVIGAIDPSYALDGTTEMISDMLPETITLERCGWKPQSVKADIRSKEHVSTIDPLEGAVAQVHQPGRSLPADFMARLRLSLPAQ